VRRARGDDEAAVGFAEGDAAYVEHGGNRCVVEFACVVEKGFELRSCV
jgi:hypothetical protein